MTDVPGGFPASERQSGAVQARVTDTGLAFVHDNMDQLTGALLDGDGPLTFAIPPSCYSDPKVCCYVPNGSCQLVFDLDPQPGDLDRITVQPLGGNQLQLTLRARVRTADWLPVHARGPLGGEISCWVYIDSRWSGYPHVTIRSILELADDPETGTLGARVVSTTLSGVSAGDVDIDGGLLCGFGSTQEAADNMNGQLRQRIPGAVEDLLCSKCDSDDDCAPFGSCGSDGICYLPDGDCMQSFGTSGRMAADALFGNLVHDAADAIDLYLAAGGDVDTGAGGVALSVLAGVLPASDVSTHACVPAVPAPALPPIAPAAALTDNSHPRTGDTYDLGIAIHRSFLERAAWAAHQSGFLCLDVGADTAPLLNAESLSILAPSLIDLTHGEAAPLFLLVRPQQAPSVELGAGTFVDVGGGEMKIDEPLFTLGLDELEIDFYAWIDGAYARILTLRADLSVPVGLDVDENGDLVPITGDLADAFTDIRVVNSGLLAETPDEIAARFPAVLSVALPALSDQLGAFEVPAVAGMTLELGPGSLTSIESDSMLGIFGNLAPTATARRLPVATEVSVARVLRDRPAVELVLGGRASSGSGAPLEWSIRVDGGFWSPYSTARRLVVDRQAFRLLGRHTIEVRAREVGAPATTGPSELVEVDLRAEPRVDRPAGVAEFHGTADGSGGCDCGASTDPGTGAGGLLLLGLVVIGLRRRAWLVAAALAIVAGCGGDPADDDGGGEPDPTVVTPGPTGRWASMATDGDRTVLAAYEQSFGDLVLAEIDGEGVPAFRVVDGAPAEPVVLDPTGYRAGVSAPGADVGAWTSVAIAGGRAQIAYQDRDRAAVMLATESGDGWAVTDVDLPDGDQRLGAFASLVIDAAGRPAIAYLAETHLPAAADADDDPGQIRAELRLARATAATPAGPADWSIEVVDEVTVPASPDFDLPTGTGLYASAGSLADGRLAIAFHRDQTGDLMLAVERAEGGWQLIELDAGADRYRGPWSTLAVDDAGDVWVAYQDAVDDRLLAIRWNETEGAAAPELIDDGRRDGDRPHSMGGGAHLLISPSGPAVAYQDGTTADLLWASRADDGSWARGTLLAGEVGYGFHIAAAGAWVSTYAYDQAHWPPGHTEVVRVP
jgi:uncharacterized protein (TIGR03382 family)